MRRCTWVLLLRERGVAVWRVTRHGARQVAEHASDEAGRAACIRSLREARGQAVALLVDLHGERFAVDSIPCLRGAERRTLLARRLAQRFAGPGYHYSRGLGRAAHGREKLFLACLRPDLLEPWLEAPERAGAFLAGVCSFPLLLSEWVSRWRPEGGECLLVNRVEGGARVSYFQEGCLRFSDSVEAPPEDSGSGPGDDFQWLLRQLEELPRRLLEAAYRARDAPPLELLLVATAACHDALRRADLAALGIRLSWLKPERAARRLGQVGAASAPDGLFVRGLARRSPPNHYAAEALLRPWRRQRRELLLSATACVLLPISLVGVIGLVYKGLRLERELLALRPAAAVSAAAPAPPSQSAFSQWPGLPWRKLYRGPSSGGLLRRLDVALRKIPELRLEELHWSLPPLVDPGQVQHDLSPRSLARSFELRARARLAPLEPRQQLATWRRLDTVLRALFPGAQVQALEWPVDPDPRAGLEGRLAKSPEPAQVFFLVRQP